MQLLLLLLHASGNTALLTAVWCLHVDRKAHVAFNFNYLIEDEGLLKVTTNHIHRKCGNVMKRWKKETLLQTTNSKDTWLIV